MRSLRRLAAAVLILSAALAAQSLPSPLSVIRTFAGTEFTWQKEGKAAVTASIALPEDVNVDAAGNIYYADNFGQAYRVSPGGSVQRIAGNGFPGDPVDGIDARKSPFPNLTGIAAGPDGIYLGFSFGIKKIRPDGTLAPVAGGGIAPGDGGPATASSVSTTTTGLFGTAAAIFCFAIR